MEQTNKYVWEVQSWTKNPSKLIQTFFTTEELAMEHYKWCEKCAINNGAIEDCMKRLDASGLKVKMFKLDGNVVYSICLKRHFLHDKEV